VEWASDLLVAATGAVLDAVMVKHCSQTSSVDHQYLTTHDGYRLYQYLYGFQIQLSIFHCDHML